MILISRYRGLGSYLGGEVKTGLGTHAAKDADSFGWSTQSILIHGQVFDYSETESDLQMKQPKKRFRQLYSERPSMSPLFF